MTTETTVSTALDQQLQEAIAWHAAGQLAEAEQGYRAILQSQPGHTQANYNLGVLLLQQGQAKAARPCFAAALQSSPEREQCWLACIEVFIQCGELAAARNLLDQALRRFVASDELPGMAERLAGIAAQAVGGIASEATAPAKDVERLIELCAAQRYADGEAQALALTERYPRDPFGWKALGVIYEGLGQAAEALPAMQRAAELQPEDAEAHFNLGNGYKSLRRLAEAEASYQRALELDPLMGQALINLGGVYCDQRRLEEAESIYRVVLRGQPNNVEANNALGVVLHSLGRYSEACDSYKRALGVDPDYCKAISNFAITLMAECRWGEAEQKFRLAVEKDPLFAQAYCGLGGCLLNLVRYEEAEVFLRKAVELFPGYAEAYSNLGVLAGRQRKLIEAEKYYRKALELKPGNMVAMGNLGSLLKDLGKGDEGLAMLRQLVSSGSSELWMFSNLLFSMTHDENVDPKILFEEHRAFGRRVEAGNNVFLSYRNLAESERRLRVGFVSADLGDHPVALFIEPVWRNLNKRKFSIYAYSNRVNEDENSKILRGYTDVWRNIVDVNDACLAKMVRDDGIDILVDLSGHTAGNRLGLFAMKPAPVQASWIGYPATTGLQAVDYYLVDKYCAPAGFLDDQFVEKLVRLPAAWAFQPSGSTPLSIPPALFKGGFTFGSFNRVNKLTDFSIRLWSRVLQAVPMANMLLGGVEEREVEQRLAEKFEFYGVGRDRLIFHPRVAFDEYQKLHNDVDLLLDAVPYTGGTTTNHGLWMGVPTLTLAGATLPGRQGAALMNHVGLPEFVADSEDDFVAKAVAWSRNLPELTVIRAGMRVRVSNSELRTPQRITLGFERALREMWRRWCLGEKPVSFEVE